MKAAVGSLIGDPRTVGPLPGAPPVPLSAPIPDGSGIVTPTEVYAEVRATYDEVKLVSAELDALPGDLADRESRIRTLEAARRPLPSIAAVAAAAGLCLYRFLSR